MAPSFDCCIKTNFHTGKDVGHQTQLAGYDTYITGSESADKAILFIADVNGISLINNRLLADKYAEAIGARVYIPDFFEGKDLMKRLEADPKRERSEVVQELLAQYPPRKVEIFPSVIEAIRKAQPSAKKVGAMGFCWGAPGAVHLGTKAAGAGQVDAIGFAHPSLIETKDFETLEKPALFLTCQHDPMFPKEKQQAAREVWEKIASENGVFVRQSYYPNVSHGWSIKGDETNPYAAKAMAHATVEAISFFSLELSS